MLCFWLTSCRSACCKHLSGRMSNCLRFLTADAFADKQQLSITTDLLLSERGNHNTKTSDLYLDVCQVIHDEELQELAADSLSAHETGLLKRRKAPNVEFTVWIWDSLTEETVSAFWQALIFFFYPWGRTCRHENIFTYYVKFLIMEQLFVTSWYLKGFGGLKCRLNHLNVSKNRLNLKSQRWTAEPLRALTHRFPSGGTRTLNTERLTSAAAACWATKHETTFRRCTDCNCNIQPLNVFRHLSPVSIIQGINTLMMEASYQFKA